MLQKVQLSGVSMLISKTKIIEQFDEIDIDSFWNTGDGSEAKMHRIHGYPAKFPAFITTRALEYARKTGRDPKVIADIFCGCGTVAYEAKRNEIDFWGYDLNPVATLIARVKSRYYRNEKIDIFFSKINEEFLKQRDSDFSYQDADTRIAYWYAPKEYIDLSKLQKSIELSVPKNSVYHSFFKCALSNILKSTSRWLTKSIKPQIDPDKQPAEVFAAFKKQVELMKTANSESSIRNKKSKTSIYTSSILNSKTNPQPADLIVTSPPYVTSYEYADLHQLSALWLGYANDYRDLRVGSIGSLHNCHDIEIQNARLNDIGREVVDQLRDTKNPKAKAVSKYYLDMQKVAHKTANLLSSNGLALFVIGNTEYSGVRIRNAEHLTKAMYDAGFNEVNVSKRKISKKILTPYRDNKGRFTKDSTGKKIYSEEFIVVGQK